MTVQAVTEAMDIARLLNMGESKYIHVMYMYYLRGLTFLCIDQQYAYHPKFSAFRMSTELIYYLVCLVLGWFDSLKFGIGCQLHVLFCV